MQLFALATTILKEGDDIVDIFLRSEKPKNNDILVISSKAVATAEGAAYDLQKLTPSAEAIALSKECGKSPAFREAMLLEIKRLNGKIVRKNRFAVLTELKPEGMDGSILAATAGLDESNAGEDRAVGWPRDPVSSARRIRDSIKEKADVNIAVIITDSCCRPRRLGVTAAALVCVGIDPFENLVGSQDLFGHTLRVTQEARADQLATAANFLMGNSDEAVPAVIIRDHGLPMTDFAGWVPGISEEEDMFSI